MARALGSRASLRGAFETGGYGVAPSAGWQALPFSTSNLGEEKGLVDDDTIGLGREMAEPTPDVANDEGDLTVPVDLRNIGFWLKLGLGDPTTAGPDGGAYTHTYHSGANDLPSASLEIGHSEVPAYGNNFGAALNTMRVQMTRGGLLNAQLGLICQGETIVASTISGDPEDLVKHAQVRFAQAAGEVKRDGVALGSVVSADFTLNNNLDKAEVIRSDGRIEGVDPGKFSLSGTVTLRFKDLVMLNQAVARTASSLSFGWSIGASKSLLVTAHRVFLPRPKRPVQGPGGVQASFAFKAAIDPGLDRAATVVLTNDVAEY